MGANRSPACFALTTHGRVGAYDGGVQVRRMINVGKQGFVNMKCCNQTLVDPSFFIWEALASWLIDFSLLAVISAGPLLFLYPSTSLGEATAC